MLGSFGVLRSPDDVASVIDVECLCLRRGRKIKLFEFAISLPSDGTRRVS